MNFLILGEKVVTECDLVIMATGYHHRLTLLNDILLEQSDDNKLKLYKDVFPLQFSHPSLAIIGSIVSNAAIFPVFEMQARWYALLMAGKCQLPSREEMLKSIKETEVIRNAIYKGRNIKRVNWIRYMNDIAKQIGVYPDFKKYLTSDFPLFLKLVFGTTLSYHYRLDGPHSWSGARNAIMEADNRIKYALNTDYVEKKSSTHSKENSFRIIISFIFLMFAFLIFISIIID